MTDKKEILIRLQEQLRIYKDSPHAPASYADLARHVEDLMEILEMKRINGFKGEVNG